MKLSGALAVGAVVLGAAAASIVPVMADVSDDSPSNAAVRVHSDAKLKAAGAAIEVTLTYRCPPGGASPNGNVDVSQAGPGGNATAHRFLTPPPCTGERQTLTTYLVPDERPFRLGTAFVKASVFAMDNSYSARDEREIEIVS